jgi:hypothetical protein
MDISVELVSREVMRLRLPHPLLLFLLTVILVIAGAGLRFGIPAYHRWSAVKQLREYADIGGMRRVGPEWLREFVGQSRMDAFDDCDGSIWFSQNPQRFGRLSPLIAGGFGLGAPPPVIDDSHLECIRNLPNLKEVHLACTDVSDGGIEPLSRLSKLEKLSLDATDVSDGCVPLLKRLPNLRELSLRGTRVSKAGVEKLERAIPGLRVTR